MRCRHSKRSQKGTGTNLRVDLACGAKTEPGWLGLDISDEVKPDFHHDLRVIPWPFDPGEIEESRCAHFFEHLVPLDRVLFMNELYRVTRPGGIAHFATPLNTWRQAQDFDHKWPPIVPGSFSYFSTAWLESQKLTHYRRLHGIECDWEKLDARAVMNSKGAMNEPADPDFGDPREIVDLIVTLRRVP